MHRSIVTTLVILTLLASSFAQSTPPPKRKKIKDFGSSLRRLKWDPEKKTVVNLNDDSKIADEGDVIRIDTSLVSCELLVVDQKGQAVSGLTAEDFAITEDGAPQTVGHFLKGDNVDVPRTIVLIIDYSGSQLPFIKESVAAAKVLIDKLGPKDLMAIVTDDVEMIQEFTTDKKKLKSKLDSLLDRTKGSSLFAAGFGGAQQLGRSKQYSALMATLNEAFTDEDIRPIIIFQTDGDELGFLRRPVEEAMKDADAEEPGQSQLRLKWLQKEMTEFSLEDLYRAVEKSRTTVYTVIPGIKYLGLPPKEQWEKSLVEEDVRIASLPKELRAKIKERREKEDPGVLLRQVKRRVNITLQLQTALAGVAPLTGGWTEFLEVPEQADAIYSRIFSDINQRYIVGYYPTNKERDGKRRKIEFVVKGHPEYQVYGRRSYFAPKF